MIKHKLDLGTKLANFMLSAWYKPKLAWQLYLLLPLEAMYRAFSYLKYKTTKPFVSHVPVIVVGNITIGGTGKTPLILWLSQYLTAKGLKVAVISRGYKARPPYFPYHININDDADIAGDEPLLIAKTCTKTNVVIDPKRVRAIKAVLANKHDVVLSDDGLQHYALGRSLELVMIDAKRGLGNLHCLPCGPLRESCKRLQNVDAVIYNDANTSNNNSNNNSNNASEHDFYIRLEPYAFINLKTGRRKHLNYFANKQVNAVAGIGNPARFFASLIKLNIQIKQYPLPDHAKFSPNMFKFLDNLPIIMTAKDAVKCQKFATENMWYLEVKTLPCAKFINWFELKINQLITKNIK